MRLALSGVIMIFGTDTYHTTTKATIKSHQQTNQQGFRQTTLVVIVVVVVVIAIDSTHQC